MRFIILVVFIFSFCHFAMGQWISKSVSKWNVDKKSYEWDKDWAAKTATKWYSQTENKGIIIQNSLPKGGGYTDSTGKTSLYRIFFTRIINESDATFELTLNFPADSFPIPSSPDVYLKFFLPSDTMCLDKEISYSYGLDLKSFFDSGLIKTNMLQRIINPKEESLFYIMVLFYTHSSSLNKGTGVARAEVVLKEQDLFYTINMLDSVQIPFGHIILKK